MANPEFPRIEERESLTEGTKNPIPESEIENIRRYVGREVRVETESQSFEFSAGPAEWAKDYLGFKDGRSVSGEEIENAEGIFSSTGAFGGQSPAILREVELGRIKIASKWIPEGEWIPFMRESRYESHVHLSGGDCYQVEIIRRIEVEGDLIFEKSIEDIEEFFPDDVKEKLKSFIGISFPGPE